MTVKGLNTWDSRKVISECKNLVKWNPILAIEWMEEEYDNIQNQRLKDFWTKTANQINFYIDSFEKSAIFNHEEYWGHRNILSRRIKKGLHE